MRHLGLIWLGGALGTAARASVGWAVPTAWVALPTLVTNVAGAFLIGLLYETLTTLSADGRPRRGLRLFLGTGVLGGFTTYSALEIAAATHGLDGLGYALTSVALGLASCWCGVSLAALIQRMRSPLSDDVRATELSPEEGDQ